ncbi:MAG: spermidine synthase [Dehalococcoidia bacterium]|nr:spermidine synthase [Dehalococcoidia bacterium]
MLRLLRNVGNVSIFLLFLLMFFGSGVSALMYEVVWTRSLALLFGVTLHAISAVLASFMAGMALGSFLVGRMADRVRWPLLYYGIMEIAIGLSAAASLTGIAAITPIYVQLHENIEGSEVLLSAVRFLMACGVMLVPTALMGATLPFMVRASLMHLSKVGENISLLYALNTAGAATGVLLAGFVMIGSYGLQTTVYTGTAINLTIGVIALVLALLTRRKSEAQGAGHHQSLPVAEPEARAGLARRLTDVLRRRAAVPNLRPMHLAGRGTAAAVLFGIAVSGFCALAYEVIWFRILDLFLNGTTYAFTVMLVTFLVGLAVGSALTRPIIGWRWNWTFVLALLQFAIGALALWALQLIPQLPVLRDELVAIPELAPLLGRPVFTMAVVVALALLPLSILLGMTFPVAAQALAHERGKEGAHIGSLNASNTLGAIGGSLAGGLVLVPLIGSQSSMLMLAGINLALAVLLAAVALWHRKVLRLAAPALAVAFLLLAGNRPADIYPEMFANLFKGHTLLWYEEGIESTVSVQRHPEGYKVMYLNSREQAYDHPAPVQYHQLIAQLGMVLHPNPRDVLVIGLGGGATPGALSRFSDSHIDVVELSESVVHAAVAQFGAINNDVMNQPNVSLKVDDGRNHLLLSGKKYDVITADIIQAHHAGSGNLYSREYFSLVKSSLKEGGLFVQWVNPGLTQIYPLVVRTIADVFPGASLMYSGTLVVASTGPVTQEQVEAVARLRFAQPSVVDAVRDQAYFRAPGLAEVSAQGVSVNYHASLDRVVAGMPPGPMLTDDRPLTEYFRSIPGATEADDPSKPRS